MANTTRTEPQTFSSIGVDIGKDVFHLVGFDSNGKVVLRRKIKRLALVIAGVSPALALPLPNLDEGDDARIETTFERT